MMGERCKDCRYFTVMFSHSRSIFLLHQITWFWDFSSWDLYRVKIKLFGIHVKHTMNVLNSSPAAVFFSLDVSIKLAMKSFIMTFSLIRPLFFSLSFSNYEKWTKLCLFSSPLYENENWIPKMKEWLQVLISLQRFSPSALISVAVETAIDSNSQLWYRPFLYSS